MDNPKMGAYGNTKLSVDELRSAAQKKLNRPGNKTLELDLFYTDKPHSGGTSRRVKVSLIKFEKGDSSEALIAQLPTGKLIAFMLNQPGKQTTTFVEIEA